MEEKRELVEDKFVEDIDEDELEKLVLEAQQEALLKERLDKENPSPIPRRRKWIVWLISIVFLFSTFSFIFQAFPIPAYEFIKISAKLSAGKHIQEYKKSVVSIVTDTGTGTGFAFSSDGKIITNAHVIEDNKQVTVEFPKDGLYTAKVVKSYPEIDLAVLKVEGEDLPYLTLAHEQTWEEEESVIFIGNPLRFQGIVNEGTIIGTIRLNEWEDEVVMMKAPVYSGNSGSPILNEKGEVIGVVFATMEQASYGKVGLFVPIELFHSRN